jgi:hypothetical protein
MEMLLRLWRGEASLRSAVFFSIVPLLVAWTISYIAFGLDSGLPLFIVYFWNIILWIFSVISLVVLARVITKHRASYQGFFLTVLVFAGIPVLAAPIASMYAHYLQQEDASMHAVLKGKIAPPKSQSSDNMPDVTGDAPQSRAKVQEPEDDYDASIKKYHDLKKQRDEAREHN